MITGVELDFVVKDCREALSLYQRVFDVQPIEATDLAEGQNEAVFSIYGSRFNMLDESPDFQLFAPLEGRTPSFWFNVAVPDIHDVYKRAMDAGCREIQPISELPDFGVSNATFADPFGYVWMLHQIHRNVSFEERMRQHAKAGSKNE